MEGEVIFKEKSRESFHDDIVSNCSNSSKIIERRIPSGSMRWFCCIVDTGVGEKQENAWLKRTLLFMRSYGNALLQRQKSKIQLRMPFQCYLATAQLEWWVPMI